MVEKLKEYIKSHVHDTYRWPLTLYGEWAVMQHSDCENEITCMSTVLGRLLLTVQHIKQCSSSSLKQANVEGTSSPCKL